MENRIKNTIDYSVFLPHLSPAASIIPQALSIYFRTLWPLAWPGERSFYIHPQSLAERRVCQCVRLVRTQPLRGILENEHFHPPKKIYEHKPYSVCTQCVFLCKNRIFSPLCMNVYRILQCCALPFGFLM